MGGDEERSAGAGGTGGDSRASPSPGPRHPDPAVSLRQFDMLEVLILLACAGHVLSRPQDLHIVFSESQSPALPALPEPRSGVAYVFSVPVTTQGVEISQTEVPTTVPDSPHTLVTERTQPSPLIHNQTLNSVS